MKIVLDTNVLVSGIIWKGTPRQVLELWADGKWQPFASMDMVVEYQRVILELTAKYPETTVDAMELLNEFVASCVIVKPIVTEKKISRDPDDDKFILAALSTNADYLVSGDNDLLTLEKFGGTEIIKPSAFCRFLLKP